MSAPDAPARLGARDAWLLAGIVLLGLGVRALHVLELRDQPHLWGLFGDAQGYREWAARIRWGELGGGEVFYQAPLYPFWLAAVETLVGEDLLRVRLVHALSSALAGGAVFLAARLLTGRASAACAGVLFALYAPAVFLAGLVHKSALAALLTASLLWLAARAQAAPGAARFVALGVVLGALALVREEALAFAPVLMAWLVWRFRGAPMPRRAAWMGALLLGLAAPLAPVLAHNLAAGGELVLSTAQAGPNLYIGNHPGAPGTYVPLVPGRGSVRYEREDARHLAEDALGRALTAREVSGYWAGRALAFARGEPRAALALLARKARLALHRSEAPDEVDQSFVAASAPLLRTLGRVLHFGVLFPLAAAGLVLARERRRNLAVVLAWIATSLVSVTLFYVFARYRFAMVPGLCILGGAGAAELTRAVRARAWPRVGAALAAAALAALVADAPLRNGADPLPVAHANAAAVLLAAGDAEGAARECRRALERDPCCVAAWSNLGLAEMRRGRRAPALEAFQAAVRCRPDDARARKQLGTALAEAGEWDEAREHLARSFALWPHDRETSSNLARVLLVLGDDRALVAHLDRRATVALDDESARLLLAWTLATTPVEDLRDGRRALALADELCPEGCADVDRLDVLAAACAEAGELARARDVGRRALALALEAGAPSAPALRARLAGYEQGRAWREPGR